MQALEVSDLRKSYTKNGSTLAILDVANFAVREGEFVTIIGPSGCGKSTFLHMMGGFIGADAGAIRVYGKEVSEPGPDRGMMFQEFALFPWKTVAGNVAWGLETQGLSKDRLQKIVDEHLGMIGLTEFRNHYPAELSGGMKQRVAIARVLVMEPEMLLMDEPFGSLDAQTRSVMQELLLSVWERSQQTVLFITHDVEEALLLADTVSVMTARPGRIKKRLTVELPRPRSLDVTMSPVFNELKREVLALIRDESLRVAREG